MAYRVWLKSNQTYATKARAEAAKRTAVKRYGYAANRVTIRKV